MNQNKFKKFGPFLNKNTKKEIGVEHRKHHFVMGVHGKRKIKIKNKK